MAGKVSLFSVISPAFFSVLSSANKETNFLLITQTEQSFGKNLTIDRKKLVDDLADFIRKMHISSVDEDFTLKSWKNQPKAEAHKRKLAILFAFLK